MNWRRIGRIALRIGAGIAALAVFLLVVSIVIVQTAWFQNFVREKIVSVTEESTGGRVEIGSFEFRLWGLAAHVRDFVLHGKEAAGEPPLFRAQTIDLRLKLLAGLKHAVDLEYLGVDHAAANVIVYPDGSTNLPEPKVVTKSNKSALETVVDLAIHKFEITNTSLTFAEQRIPLVARGGDLRSQLFYRSIPASYTGELHVGALQAARGTGAPLNGSLDIPLEIGKDNIEVKGARLATAKSQIVMNASVSRMNSPQIEAHAMARVSLEEVGRTAGVELKPCTNSTPCFADADFTLRTNGGNLEDARFKLDVGSSELSGSADADRAVHFVGRIAAAELGRLLGERSVPEITVQANGKARMAANQLAISSSISTGEFGMGRGAQSYSGAGNGSLEVQADLNAKGTAGVQARAELKILPGRRGVPMRGEIHAAYNGAADSVDFTKSSVVLAHSRLDFSGTLGRHLDVNLVSTDTSDFLPALAIAQPAQAPTMPVQLNRGGQLTVHANVEGPVARPLISGTVAATAFAVNARPFDSLGASFNLSHSGISIREGTLARQTLLARFSGSVGMRNWSLDDRSPLQVDANLQNGDIADALALAGQAQVPAKGALTASAKIGGTIGNPLGAIQLNATNGIAYDQPFDRANVNVELADQLIRLNSAEVAQGNAKISATGTYPHRRENLLDGTANLQVTSSGVDLATIAAMTKEHAGLAGTVQLNATAAAKIDQHHGDTEVLLSSLNADVQANGLRDAKQNYGNLTAHVAARGSKVDVRADSNLTGAAIHIAGSTTLPTTDLLRVAKAELKEFPLVADVSIQNATLEPLLALAGQELPATGRFGLTGHVAGTAADPTGSGTVSLHSASVYGEPIDSLTAEVRLEDQMAELRSLSATSPAGSIRASGTFRHPRNQFDQGEIEVKADSTGLRIARIRTVRDANPALDGTLKLSMTGSATLAANHEITVKKIDGSISANAITYNGKAFGEASVTAESRNGAIALQATSNFAGSTIRMSGEARPVANMPLTATVTVANLKFANLRPFLDGVNNIQPDFDALIEARASVNGPAMKPEQMTGSIEVQRLELTTKQGIALKNDGAVAADYSQRTLRIRNAHLTGRSTDINIAGTAQFSGASPLNLTVKANSDLNLVEQIDKSIHASGAIAVDTVVRGAVTQPLLNGSVELKNASINVEPIPNGLTNANGVIALRGETASITNLTAETGGGKLTLTGFAAKNGSNVRYTLRANAAHVRTRYQGVSVVNSANLTLGGTLDHSVINGSVTVERLGFNPQSDIGSMLAELAHGSGPRATDVSNSGVMSSIQLDVRVHTAPDARFQTTFARTLEAQADLNVTGTLEQPGIVGRVSISDGDMIFFGNEYLVTRGVIAFYNPAAIDPQINISLATTVRNINVTLTMEGAMDNLKLTYVSDPPLQFDEIVSLLTTGKRPSSDPSIVASQAPAPQQSVGEMGASALVSQTVASPLADRLQRVFGVSQLRIDPTFAGGSALPIARLTLQQRVSNTITFTYSQDLSQSNSELIRVEWAVSPKFSAVATRDENGIFGVDFFYKLRVR